MDRNKVKLTNNVRTCTFLKAVEKEFWSSKQWLKSFKSKNRFLKKLSDALKIFILRSNSPFLVIELSRKIFRGIYIYFKNYFNAFFPLETLMKNVSWFVFQIS